MRMMGGGFEARGVHDHGIQEDHPQPHPPAARRDPPDKLTATRIARHYRDLEDHGRNDEYGSGQPLSANSVHKVHVVLGAILDAAIDDGHLTVNPRRRSAL